MAKQKGSEKQVPLDQSSRGKNQEHEEGQANDGNHQRQTGGRSATRPGATPSGS